VVSGGACGVGRRGILLGDDAQAVTLNVVMYISVNKKILPSVLTKIDNGKMSISVYGNVYSMRT
jgi:hypothetical protein